MGQNAWCNTAAKPVRPPSSNIELFMRQTHVRECKWAKTIVQANLHWVWHMKSSTFELGLRVLPGFTLLHHFVSPLFISLHSGINVSAWILNSLLDTLLKHVIRVCIWCHNAIVQIWHTFNYCRKFRILEFLPEPDYWNKFLQGAGCGPRDFLGSARERKVGSLNLFRNYHR